MSRHAERAGSERGKAARALEEQCMKASGGAMVFLVHEGTRSRTVNERESGADMLG